MKKHTTYIVTGAAGFLGGTVCRVLAERGEIVRAFVLPGDKAKEYLPSAVEVVEGDLCDKDSLEELFAVNDESDVIVLHIASIVTVNPEFSQKVMDVNVGGTANIIEFCRKCGHFKKLVYVSSTGAIPELPKGQTIREVSSFDPDKVPGCYSKSKAMATQLVLDAVAEGLDATVVHPTGILGPEDYSLGETSKPVIQIIKGEMPAGIAGSFNLCDVRDLADGVISASEKGRTGECYILGNEEVSFKRFARIVADVAGCKRMRMFIPCSMAYVLAKLAELKAKMDGSRPLMTTFSVYNLARNNSFDSSKASKELDFHPKSYEDTITDQVNWLREFGAI